MRKTTLLPTLFFLCGAAGVALLAIFTERADDRRVLRETILMRDQVVLRLQACIDARARPVEALAAHPWTSLEQVEQEWPLRAGTLHGMYDSILALNFADRDWRIRIIYPQAANATAQDFDLHNHPSPSVPETLTRAERTAELQPTAILQLLQGGTGFAIYQRITDPAGTILGFANGVFRLEQLMETCLNESALRDRFALRLSETGGAVFWELNNDDDSAAAGFAARADFDVLGRPWTLQISPTQAWIESQSNPFHLLRHLLSLALVAALALLLRSLMLKHEKLQRSEHQYRLLVENQSDFVVQVNAAGEFEYVNPSYCRLVGKTEAALLGRPFTPFVHEDDLAIVTQSLATLKRPPHTCYHEQRAPTREGWRWLAWSNSAVLDAQGEIASITAVGRDVTDLRRLEARAAHAEKMQALGNLAGGISHDFNNILHVVLANIEFLMLDHPDNAGLQSELTSISHTLERAISLVGRLATLSRQDPVRKDTFDLNTFTDEILALLRRTLPPAISLQLEVAAQPLLVHADRSQLEQVLLNICFNARDAIDGNGVIRITLERSQPQLLPETSDARTHACICIRDDGKGIAPEVLPHIFEPFFTTKPQGSGTGLGLANCHSIIKQHMGEIRVESAPGAGTEFRIYLPLQVASGARVPARSADGTAPAAPRLPASESSVAAPQEQRSVLVVDDDPEILRLTAALLRNGGYTTQLASNGEEALQLLAQQSDSITLVLMDVLMPVLGGLEAAERMHTLYPHLPVLLMSGYVPEGRQAGKPLLRKPFTREALLLAIQLAYEQKPDTASG